MQVEVREIDIEEVDIIEIGASLKLIINILKYWKYFTIIDVNILKDILENTVTELINKYSMGGIKVTRQAFSITLTKFSDLQLEYASL